MACGDEVGAGAGVELGHRGGVSGHHQGRPAGANVGPPRLVDGFDHGVPVAVLHATVVQVGVGCGGVAVAQGEAGGGFPFVPEPSHVNQFGRVCAVGDQEPEGAAGGDRGQLCRVPDQQHLRPDLAGLGGEGVEFEGACHGGFVDDDQLPAAQPPPVKLRPDLAGASGQGAGPKRRAGAVKFAL